MHLYSGVMRRVRIRYHELATVCSQDTEGKHCVTANLFIFIPDHGGYDRVQRLHE